MMRIEWMEEEEAGWINYGQDGGRFCAHARSKTRANCVQRRTAGIKMECSGFQPWREAKAKDPNWKKNVCKIGKGFPGSRVTWPKHKSWMWQNKPFLKTTKLNPPFFNLTTPPQVQRGEKRHFVYPEVSVREGRLIENVPPCKKSTWPSVMTWSLVDKRGLVFAHYGETTWKFDFFKKRCMMPPFKKMITFKMGNITRKAGGKRFLETKAIELLFAIWPNQAKRFPGREGTFVLSSCRHILLSQFSVGDTWQFSHFFLRNACQRQKRSARMSPV